MTRSLVTPERRKTIIRTTSISFGGKEEGHILKLEKQEGSGLQMSLFVILNEEFELRIKYVSMYFMDVF